MYSRRLIENVVRKTLKRIIKESMNDDLEWVNTEEDGGKPMYVGLWCGSGYGIDEFGVYASDLYEAIERVVAYLDRQGDTRLLRDKDAEIYEEELREDGLSQEEIDDEMELVYLYVDATMEGARQTHYINREGLRVENL